MAAIYDHGIVSDEVAIAPAAKRRKVEHLNDKLGQCKKDESDYHIEQNGRREFWDSLSKIPFCKRALEEFDHRTRSATERLRINTHKPTKQRPRLTRADHKRLVELTLRGGPDLTQLRGYAGRNQSCEEHGTGPDSYRRRAKRPADASISPYGAAFEQRLIDLGVFTTDFEDESGIIHEPQDLQDIRDALRSSGKSLSQGTDFNKDFKDYRQKIRNTTSETETLLAYVPTAEGKCPTDIDSAFGTTFTTLKVFDECLTKPKPDLYYGARPHEVALKVREELADFIVPSTHTTLPVAPNFFFEAKSNAGSPAVADRQAMYNGAVGARAILKLQEYGIDSFEPDGNAYTLVITYTAGALNIFATHPMKHGQHSVRYYTTPVHAFAIRGSVDQFREGILAFRNARDWADQQRKRAIDGANERARGILESGRSPTTLHLSTSHVLTDFDGEDGSSDEIAADHLTPLRRRG